MFGGITAGHKRRGHFCFTSLQAYVHKTTIKYELYFGWWGGEGGGGGGVEGHVANINKRTVYLEKLMFQLMHAHAFSRQNSALAHWPGRCVLWCWAWRDYHPGLRKAPSPCSWWPKSCSCFLFLSGASWNERIGHFRIDKRTGTKCVKLIWLTLSQERSYPN